MKCINVAKPNVYILCESLEPPGRETNQRVGSHVGLYLGILDCGRHPGHVGAMLGYVCS